MTNKTEKQVKPFNYKWWGMAILWSGVGGAVLAVVIIAGAFGVGYFKATHEPTVQTKPVVKPQKDMTYQEEMNAGQKSLENLSKKHADFKE